MTDDVYLSKAIEIVEESAYTDAQRMAYDKFWDEISSWRTLTKGYFRQGHAEGRAEGRAEEQAKAYREKLESAKALKALGILPVAQIAQIMGLSEEDVAAL